MQYSQDKWVPVTTAWHVLRLRMEERPQIWKVAVNTLNKQSRTAEKDGTPTKGLGGLRKTPHRKNLSCYKI